MNALMKPIESMSVIERAANALNQAETEEQIKALVEESKPIVAVTDPASREVCHSSLMTLKNMRVLIQNRGKDGRDEAVKYSKAVIAIEKELVALITPEETRLAAIRDEWDTARDREKEARIQAEIARAAEIQRRIDGIRNWPIGATGQESLLVGQMLAQAQTYRIEEAVFQERCEEAKAVLGASIAALTGILAQRKAHEAEQEQLKRDQAELAQRRAADAERDRLAKIESDRIAQEAHDKRVAEAREHAEQIRKDRARNEAALQEIQAIHHQLIIADTGRAPYCKGRDLESIDFAIDGTEKWELTEERFGPLFDSAVKTKETTLEALRQKRVDFIARQEVAKRLADERVENERKAAERQAELDAQAEAQRAETQRLADQQAEINRQQEELRKANEPKPAAQEPPTPAPPSAQPENWPITDAQLVALVMIHCSVGRIKADRRIRDYGKK